MRQFNMVNENTAYIIMFLILDVQVIHIQEEGI